MQHEARVANECKRELGEVGAGVIRRSVGDNGGVELVARRVAEAVGEGGGSARRGRDWGGRRRLGGPSICDGVKRDRRKGDALVQLRSRGSRNKTIRLELDS